ncbi:hypothetical protein EST38_g7283 [Candolleomyces aberdarensis]|uniref:cytochrome-b5 reductase n=1 Tax=Candolleomyces aberdarensis TaxID=2316362 RepID=A0A4Q2DHD8_9AGAR|nr:hypothetical protein EST38_g7283 [Candolleomyces aberdarensis]
MSFLRVAASSRPLAYQACRRYSTAPAAPKKAGVAPWLLGFGVLAAGGYAYLERTASPKQEKSPLDPEQWKDFKLKKIRPYNHNTSEFVFELPNNEASLIPVASCLIVKSSDPEVLKDAKGKPIIRPYTPISGPDHKGELVLLVKKYDEGKASKHIHELKEGETLSLKGPISKFPYKANEFEEVALIGGGSGITPLYQIVTHALADKSNKTKFKLLFANVTEKDILLKEELDGLKKKYPNNFDVVYILDKPSEGWTGPTGYVSADLIKQHVKPATLNEKVKVFVCGPPGQVAALAGKKAGMKQGELGGVLKELGYTEDQPKLRPQPPVTYYNPASHKGRVTFETDELSLRGEEPYEDADSDDGRSRSRRSASATLAAAADEKPVRILTNFTAYDRNHNNEMVALGVVETNDRVGRDVVLVGYARPVYDEKNEEDEGQEDELDQDGDEDDPLLLELSAVMTLSLDYTELSDPLYVQTNWAWYKLEYPSKEYEPVHTHFMFPESVAQVVIANAKNHRRESLGNFLDKFKNSRHPILNRPPYVEQDLWDSVPQILEALQTLEHSESIVSTPLIQAILKNSGAFKTFEERRQVPPSVRQKPGTRHTGNPDDAALKEANQNATQVTPLIAKLAEGYVEEKLRVVGPRPPQPSKAELDRNEKDRRSRICELVHKGKKKKKNVHWEKEDRIQRSSRFINRVRVEGEMYEVGDVIVVPNNFRLDFWKSKDLYDIDLKAIPSDAKLHDFFWFAKIHWISHDTFDAHVQWFEHGIGLLQELAHDQHLYLSNLCGDIDLKTILGKVDVHWKVPVDQWKTVGVHDFICNSLYNHRDGSFVDLPDDAFAKEIPPPDNCPVCALREQQKQEKTCMNTNDENGTENGFTHGGHKYHYEDFVAYYSDDRKVANIGFITGMQFQVGRNEEVGYVTCKKVGRISDLKDILPADILRDERHLFLTDEVVKVKIENLLGVVFAPCKETLTKNPTLQEWLDFSHDHFFVKYRFPTSRPTSWNQKVKICWKEHAICTICCNERCEEVKMSKKLVKNHQRKPLKAMDIFGGVGAFSDSIAQACGAIKVTHAIEVAPSAAHTIQHNFPDVTVYNQCANTMLQYTVKSWEGHPVRRPYQLYNEDIDVPLPPKKGEIKVITAGFPCQSHSSMNIYRRTNDIKSNLVLNALSWIDTIRPYYVFLENVQGFLSYRLNATQASEHRVEGGIEMGGLKLLVRAMLDMGGYPLPDLPQPSHAYEGPSLEIKLPYYLGKEPVKPIRVTPGTALHKTVTIEDAIGDLPAFDWKPPQTRRRAQHIVPRYVDGKMIPLIECTKSKPSCGLSGAPPYRHKARTRFQAEARMKEIRDLQQFTKVFKPNVVTRVTKIDLRRGADYRSLAARHQEWQLINPESSMGRLNYKSGAYGRLDKDDVFPTIVTNVAPTAKQGRVLHYIYHRIVTPQQGHDRRQLRISLVGKWISDQQNAIPVDDDSDEQSDVEMEDADEMYASS